MVRVPITDDVYQPTGPDNTPGLEDQAVQALEAAGVDPSARRLENMPDEWKVSRPIPLPASCTWARYVCQVPPTARIARDFIGAYISTSYRRSKPGDVAIICLRDSVVVVGIAMPWNMWYQTNMTPVARQGGWGVLVRDHLRGWVALSHAERILRVCSESSQHLEEHRRQLQIRSRQMGSDAVLRLLARAQRAIDEFEATRQRIIGDPSVLQLDTIRHSFEDWVSGVCAHTQRDRDDVLDVLSLVIANDTQEQQPDPNAMAEQLLSAMTELCDILHSAGIDTHTEDEVAPVVGLRRGLDDLQTLLQTSQQQALLGPVDNVAMRVVLGNPLLRQRLARDETLQRMATRVDVRNPSQTGLVEDYLETTYGIPVRGLSVQAVQQALRAAGVEGVPGADDTPPRQPGRRLSRNLRLLKRD